MKYRMQPNEHLEGIRLMRGDEAIPTRGLTGKAVAYHEAVVEFWQEIERLRAERDELLAACKAGYELIPVELRKHRFTEWMNAIIARCEGGRMVRSES